MVKLIREGKKKIVICAEGGTETAVDTDKRYNYNKYGVFVRPQKQKFQFQFIPCIVTQLA